MPSTTATITVINRTQFDADLTTVANAIRAKGGTTAELEYPQGFVTAIENLPTSGGGLYRYTEGLTNDVEDETLTAIAQTTFRAHTRLKVVRLPNVTSIGAEAFAYSGITSLHIGTNLSEVCTLSNVSALSNTTSLQYIYVPNALVNAYKSATNWSTYANKIIGE